MTQGDMQAGAPTPSHDPPALELDRVTKRFGEVVAVDDVSLAVDRGEFFSLLGPSGCGKTTTLRMLAGFEEPTEGRVLLDGIDATQIPPFKRPTNLVFQNYALFPHMSVYRNVAFGPRRAKLPKDEIDRRVREALRTVQMEELADRMPAQMSGGQQQRVGLARALVNNPLVLLLDEPLGALDLKLRKEMQIELKRIQRDVGISFVYVTHDQEEAMTMSDRIAVMRDGRVDQLGSPREIYFNPTTRFVADFIGTTNLLPATLSRSREPIEVTIGARTFRAGTIASAAGIRPADGDPVSVMIRPESFVVSRDRPAQGDSIDVIVVESTFQGTGLRLDLRTVDGDVGIVAVVPPEDAAWRPGDRASVGWDPSKLHVVGEAAP